MKRFFTISKVCMIALMCVLFLGVGLNVKAAAPNKVTGLKQLDATSNTVRITWNVPAASEVIGYQIEYSKSSSFDAANTSVGFMEKNTCTIPYLASGTTYYIRVAGMDTEENIGAYSDAVEVVTSPSGGPTNFKHAKVVSKSATFSWKKVTGANSYIVEYRKVGSNGAWKTKNVGNVSSYKLSASANAKYNVNVYAVRKSKSGYEAINYTPVSGIAGTTPKKVTKVKMLTSGETGKPNAGSVYFSWTANSMADGYECTVYGNNNKKMFTKSVNLVRTTSGNIAQLKSSKLKNDQFMKIKVRAYFMINGKKTYGAWSDDYYFAKFPKGKLDKNASKGIKVSWSKIKGAKDYTVYISKNRERGYKKATTTKKNSCLITKCNGSKIVSGRTYYIKVVANKKVGKKTFKSDDTWYLSGTIYTTYR